MKRTAIQVAMLGVLLMSGASASATVLLGVYGPKGNDTGGIIPWSPENERMSFEIAQSNCSFHGKHAVLRANSRVPGDFISYECRFEAPRSKARGN
jgi:hypothetical protein